MKRKTELILAWIANGLSSLYLLFVIIGYFCDEIRKWYISK
ncbi:hypothetical protein ACO2FJ_07810 [Staphylococcus warneri]